MYVLGIDPSLSATAVYVLASDGSVVHDSVYRSKPQDGVSGRILRCCLMATAIERDIEEYRPLVVCIEGYSMGSNNAQHSAIIEHGHELRRMLCGLGCTPRVVEVAPSTLKKFATGKGIGDKSAMGSHLTKRYGVQFNSNDEADAYGLARMALCIAGYSEPANQAQREAVEVAVNGKAKRPGKSKRAMASGGTAE